MNLERKIPFPMSQTLEASWFGASKMSAFATLPEPMKDRAIAKFLRNRRPDLFDLIFLGDYLLWTLGAPIPGSSPENGSQVTPVDLRMSPFLYGAVTKLTSSMDYTATPDPIWKTILKLCSSNEEAFDFSKLGDGLAYYLACLELQAPPD